MRKFGKIEEIDVIKILKIRALHARAKNAQKTRKRRRAKDDHRPDTRGGGVPNFREHPGTLKAPGSKRKLEHARKMH